MIDKLLETLKANVIKERIIKRQCPKYCVNEKTGFRYNLLYLDSVFKYTNGGSHPQTLAAIILFLLCSRGLFA